MATTKNYNLQLLSSSDKNLPQIFNNNMQLIDNAIATKGKTLLIFGDSLSTSTSISINIQQNDSCNKSINDIGNYEYSDTKVQDLYSWTSYLTDILKINNYKNFSHKNAVFKITSNDLNRPFLANIFN